MSVSVVNMISIAITIAITITTFTQLDCSRIVGVAARGGGEPINH